MRGHLPIYKRALVVGASGDSLRGLKVCTRRGGKTHGVAGNECLVAFI